MASLDLFISNACETCKKLAASLQVNTNSSFIINNENKDILRINQQILMLVKIK